MAVIFTAAPQDLITHCSRHSWHSHFSEIHTSNFIFEVELCSEKGLNTMSPSCLLCIQSMAYCYFCIRFVARLFTLASVNSRRYGWIHYKISKPCFIWSQDLHFIWHYGTIFLPNNILSKTTSTSQKWDTSASLQQASWVPCSKTKSACIGAS